jgi:putative intracellular protease/amidase
MPATEETLLTSRDPLTVQILLFDGFDLLDALGPYEVFQAAKMFLNGEMCVDLVSTGGARSVKSGLGGLEIATNGPPDLTAANILLVPGAAGSLDSDDEGSVPALLAREANGPIIGVVRDAMERGDVTVAAVCGGSLILAMGGLVGSRPAVTHRLGMEALAATGATPIAARVVDDGRLVTAGGVTSGIDLALHLVEREVGPCVAHAIEALFEHERRGTVWRGVGPKPFERALASEPEVPPMIQHPAGTPLKATSVEGKWDVTVLTPIGKQRVLYEFQHMGRGVTGTAAQDSVISALENCVLVGDRLSWVQRVQRPMRLTLKFDVIVTGDELKGSSKAGLLPASRVVGHRLSLDSA